MGVVLGACQPIEPGDAEAGDAERFCILARVRRAFLTDDDQAAVYCPACAEEEFGEE